ncbi:uncharacterized protein LOC132901828 [Amyelois transitella]|uniref:uncharacterized protein LOC132901828 n=1 Tax=Amyelois transitella TaxID=680683 RepID=UPI0029900A65|nr:uncharacterized protein LOC132901828 [Amyelois transitella]
MDNIEISTVDIYHPLTPPQNLKRQALVIKHHDRYSNSLDDVVLEIMGADPSIATVYGKPIQNDLAVRFEFIATSGLENDHRKELLRAHLPPVNCKLIDAPSLNPEIKAAITDNFVKRDKAIYNKQKQIASAIACLSEAITLLLSKDNKDPVVLSLLMDTGRILCDSQHNDSITRRNTLLSILKGELKEQIMGTKIDTMLFGKELARTLRTAKEIKKSGDDLKGQILNANPNAKKLGNSKKNSHNKGSGQIAQVQRSKAPITDYIVVENNDDNIKGNNSKNKPKESLRPSNQSHKVDCWQQDRFCRSPRESRPSTSSSQQRG